MAERPAETRTRKKQQQRYRRLTYLTVLALLLAGCGVWFAARAGWSPLFPPDSGSSPGDVSLPEDGPGGSGSSSQAGAPGSNSSEDDRSLTEDPGQPVWFVPESEAVDASWYDDAVFLGDSRLDGFRLYAGPSGATYFTEAGAKALSIADKNTERLPDGSKVPILKALEGRTFSKVYLNLGMNNLGDYDIQKEFVDAYAADIDRIHDRKLDALADIAEEAHGQSLLVFYSYRHDIDRIREIQPDCDIYLMTLFPVTAEQEAKGSYVNNRAIADLNSCIRYLAAEKGVYLLEVDSVLTDADGNLPEESSFDGIHLTPEACKLWRQYLDTHTVQKSAAESERS